MNFEDYETLPTNNVATHMTAGAIAGVMEHCVMYPLDSVKTRMQSLVAAGNEGISATFLRMVRHEGVLRPVRGMSAMVVGAGPSHALYFSSYEHLKNTMIKHTASDKYHTLIYGLSGCFATLLHDGIMNPAEVVKQRMQMLDSPYRSVVQCVRHVYRSEGPRAFYRSYTTQLSMNIPFQSMHFMVYEFCQKVTNRDGAYNPAAHMASGAAAGAVASAVTTPLDVCKTLLNTQQGGEVSGFVQAVKTVYRLGGPAGYFRGMGARVMYQMPATAICWSTYEFFKYILGSHETTRHAEDKPTNTANTSSSSSSPSSPSSASSSLAAANLNLRDLQPRELPAMSGAGLYGSISFNTMHNADTASFHCRNKDSIVT